MTMNSDASEIQLAAIRRACARFSAPGCRTILLVTCHDLAHSSSFRAYLPVDGRHSNDLILKAVDGRDTSAHLIPCARRFDRLAHRIGQALGIADSEVDPVDAVCHLFSH